MSLGDEHAARATVTRCVVDGGLVLRVSGELDLATAVDIRGALSAATEGMQAPSMLVLDITMVEFLSAAGVHLLRGIMTSCASQGVRSSLVVDTGSHAQRLLRMVALSDDIRMFTSVDAAIASKV